MNMHIFFHGANNPCRRWDHHGACFWGCTSADTHCFYITDGSLLQLKVLHVLQFDSTRKRMSIIIEHPVTQEIVMYSKGADSAILSRLRSSWEGRKCSISLILLSTHTFFINLCIKSLPKVECFCTCIIRGYFLLVDIINASTHGHDLQGITLSDLCVLCNAP